MNAVFKRDWFGGWVLVAAVIVTYSPVWWAGYVWDDNGYITGNPCLIGLGGLKEIWTTSAADVSPLTFTTFWVEHALWGLAPLPFHLVNVLLHGACSVVLWRVLLSLRVPGAWLGAALWALHPVQAESVSWVTETKNSQSGLFFLLVILFFLKFLRGRTGWCYGWMLVFAALALASKTSTVVLPAVLLLGAWWVEGRWNWRNVARVLPLFFMSAAAAAVSMWTQKLQMAAGADAQGAGAWPVRLAAAGDAVWFYLGKLIWPYPLFTGYPRWEIDAGWWGSYVPLLAVIAVMILFWWKRESWARPWFFGFAYFIVALLPILGLVNMFILQFGLVFDHFQYLASMGPMALVGAGLTRFGAIVLHEKAWLQSGLCGVLLLILGILSWAHAWDFESEKTLWTHTLMYNPTSWMAHNNLGSVLLAEGQLDGAIGEYEAALKSNPWCADAYNNLGDIFLNRGEYDAALAQYQNALKINPNLPEAHSNLGTALARKGRMDEAIAAYRDALEINPEYAHAHNNLGSALLQKGQVDGAIAEFEKAVELDPADLEAQVNAGVALYRKGLVDEAMGRYEKVLEIDPNEVQAHINLGVAFFNRGRVDEAVAQFQEVLRLKPDDRDAQNDLAKVEAMARQRAGQK